jgi:membrane dipeptidase
MEAGGLDAAFLIVYVGQSPQLNDAGFARAYAQAMEKFAAVHRLTDTLAPTRVGLARTAAEARRIHASGRKVIFIGIENGFPVGSDLTRIKQFADLGGRYLSLAHNGHSQLSDSATPASATASGCTTA